MAEPIDLSERVSLRRYNTFGVEAQGRYMAVLRRPEDVAPLMTDPRLASSPRLILGSGSNVLIRSDFSGLVLLNRMRGMAVIADDGDRVRVSVAAGENWHEFVRRTITMGLAGLENLSLIPGTVGAAPLQNIGAYGVELSGCLESLEAIDLTDGRPRIFDRAACQFGYRDSLFKSVVPDRYLITSVTFELFRTGRFVTDYRGVREELAEDEPGPLSASRISDAICRLRRRKLPDPARLGNAGSFFKNPRIDGTLLDSLRGCFPALPWYPLDDGGAKLSAAWMIEQCGWKGRRWGDAGVSERHALVLVNHGDASGQDIWRLAMAIRDSVAERFGVELEPEPRVL
jgi:UDP-N-acetylmuramate dehydrogenase